MVAELRLSMKGNFSDSARKALHFADVSSLVFFSN